MRTRILLTALVLVAVFTVGAVSSRAEVGGQRQWSVVNILDPLLVKGTFVMGPVLIVHDDEKMGRGQPCTTFYRFDPARGPQEEIVSFHCKPVRRTASDRTIFTSVGVPAAGCKRLVEYQIAGDAEAHGVPSK